MDEIDRICVGLTSKQQLAMVRQPLDGQVWHGRDYRFSWAEVGRNLKDRGLIEFVQNPRRSDTAFTELGLAVRARLAEVPSNVR